MKACSCLMVIALAAAGMQAANAGAAGFANGVGGDHAIAQVPSVPAADRGPRHPESRHGVALPPPVLNGTRRLAQLLQQRRSVRDFAVTPLALAGLGQLLWAAQGATANGSLRTAPSAGALYPLELYVVAGDVDGLPAGIYRYDPRGHRLAIVESGDERRAVAAAAVQQAWIAEAPAIVVFGAAHARTAAKYRSRASRYVAIEAGAAAENLFLQAEDLGLGTVIVGAFDDRNVIRLLRLPQGVEPLLLMPVGVPR